MSVDMLAHCCRCDGYIDVYLNRCIDCNARHGSWLDDEHRFMRVAAVIVSIVIAVLVWQWVSPPHQTADHPAQVGAPESPVLSPGAVTVDSGAETNGGQG